MHRFGSAGRYAVAITLVASTAAMAGMRQGRAQSPVPAPAPPVSASAAGAFTPLFDGTLRGWTLENGSASSFTAADGVLRVEGPAGWLRASGEYRNFVLRTGVRMLTPDADSGIFVRAVGSSVFMRGWPGDSYQVQVRAPAAPGPLPPVGGLFRHGPKIVIDAPDVEAVRKAFTGVGEWQRLEVEVSGTVLQTRLNGATVMRAEGLAERAGSVGIQAETGVLEYRAIEIRPLP
jgi:hypothetical protein